MRTMLGRSVCVLSTVMVLSCATQATLGADECPVTQPAEPQETNPTSAPPRTVRRAYNVSDILALRTGNASVHNMDDNPYNGYVAQANMSGAIYSDTPTGPDDIGVPAPSNTKHEAEEAYVRELVDAVRQIPGKETGAWVGEVSMCGNLLFVQDTLANQKLIANELNAIREQLSTQVVLDMRVLKIDKATYIALTKDPTRFIAPEQLEALLQAPEHSEKVTILAAPRLIVTSSVSAGISHSISQPYLQSITQARPETLLPGVSTLTTGWSVNAKATVMADHKRVVVHVTPALTSLRKFAQTALPEHWKEKHEPVDVYTPEVDMSLSSSSLVIPSGRYAVLGGQEFNTGKLSANGTKFVPSEHTPPEEQYLVILIRPTIIETNSSDAKR